MYFFSAITIALKCINNTVDIHCFEYLNRYTRGKEENKSRVSKNRRIINNTIVGDPTILNLVLCLKKNCFGHSRDVYSQKVFVQLKIVYNTEVLGYLLISSNSP